MGQYLVIWVVRHHRWRFTATRVRVSMWPIHSPHPTSHLWCHRGPDRSTAGCGRATPETAQRDRLRRRGSASLDEAAQPACVPI